MAFDAEARSSLSLLPLNEAFCPSQAVCQLVMAVKLYKKQHKSALSSGWPQPAHTASVSHGTPPRTNPIMRSPSYLIVPCLMSMLSPMSAQEVLPPGHHFVLGEAVRLPLTAAAGAGRWEAWSTTGLWGAYGDCASGATTVTLPPLPVGLYCLTGPAGAPLNFAVGPKVPDPTADSRRGVFMVIPDDPTYGAQPAPAGYAERCSEMAGHLRRLGAGWVRYNFWEGSYGTITVQGDSVTVTPHGAGLGLEACRKAGLSVMGEFAQMPRALSSATDDGVESHEGATSYHRKPPRSQAQWASFVEGLVGRFRGQVTAWQTWNEPDARDFWLGTPEQFAEMTETTAQAIKRADPQALVVCSGFTKLGPPFLDRMLTSRPTLAPLIDVVSIHEDIAAPFREVMTKHGIGGKPIWHTEAKPDAVRLDLALQGIAREFHFLNRQFSEKYAGFQCLADANFVTTRAGLSYALHGSLLAGFQQTSFQDVDGRGEVALFKDAAGAMAAAWRKLRIEDRPGRVTLTVRVRPGTPLTLTDGTGTATTLTPDNAGRIELPLDRLCWLTGAQQISIAGVTPPIAPRTPQEIRATAETARAIGPWTREKSGVPARAPEALNLFQWKEPGEEGYRIEQPFSVTDAGRYRLYAISIAGHALAGARWASPFLWRLDGGRSRLVNGPMPAVWRWSRTSGGLLECANEPVSPGEYSFTAGPEMLQELGTVELTPGEHTFQLELVQGRLHPDNAWSFQPYEGIVLRKESEVRALFSQPSELPASPAEGDQPGTSIPLLGSGFEEGDARTLPPAWRQVESTGPATGLTYISPGYEHKEGAKALLMNVHAGETVQIFTTLYWGQVSALLGRQVKPGDSLVLRAWTRHYPEEGGAQPDALRLGFSTHRDPNRVRDPHAFVRPAPAKTYARIEGRWTLTAADLAEGGPFRVYLETEGPAAAQGSALWDGVVLSVVPSR